MRRGRPLAPDSRQTESATQAGPRPQRVVKESKGIETRTLARLKPTPVFDTFWHFAATRQEIFMRRLAGAEPPWTADPILARYRFTNPYRASDRVTQYLIRNVLYDGSQVAEEIFFRAALFRLFNKIETWESLLAKVGQPTWCGFDRQAYERAFAGMIAEGKSIYSAAYIIPPPRLGAGRKYLNHLRLLRMMMANDAPSRIKSSQSLSDVYHVLRFFPSIGAFLAYQLAIDLNYSGMINFSENDFVVAGPGARNGIRKCFFDLHNASYEQTIQTVASVADQEFARRGLAFQTLWGRPLQLVDYQNLFCEVDKYARLAHPSFTGGNKRSRIKHKYTMNPKPLPQWYPPKWGVRVPRRLLQSR